MMKWIRVLCLGDSLTAGSRDPYGLCWPVYMAHEARADAIVLPEIEAKEGRTSGELVRVALQALDRSAAKEVFILIGTNDAKDEIDTPVELYVANVQLLIGWCEVLGKRPYVLTIPLPQGFGSPGYTQNVVERIKAYNRALHESLTVQRGYVVECENVRKFADGIHLTPDGAREIGKRAWEKVRSARTFS